MNSWGAAAFVATFVLAVYDAQFTVGVLKKYGVVAETNPGVTWFAKNCGSTGIYIATILPTLVVLTGVTLAQSELFLGAILGVRLCLFRFQMLSKKLQSEMDDLKRDAG